MFNNYVLSSDQRFSNELIGLIKDQLDVLSPILLWPCEGSVTHTLNTLDSDSSDYRVGPFATRQGKYLLRYNETFFFLLLC